MIEKKCTYDMTVASERPLASTTIVLRHDRLLAEHDHQLMK